MGHFFRHGNQVYLPSLSKHGSLRPAKRKSSIIGLILPENFTRPNEGSNVSAKIFDGAAIINMLVLTNCKNFLQYASEVFIPFIRSQAVNIQRIDVVWDRYFQDSFKSETRNNQGAGVRTKAFSNKKIPRNWTKFFRCSDNKGELLPFLSIQLISGAPNNKIVVATGNEIVVSNRDIDLNDMMPGNIEGADERLLLQTLHVSKSFDRFPIKTVDSDVVIIATAAFQKIPSIKELWIEISKGKSIKFIPVYETVSRLGQLTSTGLTFCHALLRLFQAKERYNSGMHGR